MTALRALMAAARPYAEDASVIGYCVADPHPFRVVDIATNVQSLPRGELGVIDVNWGVSGGQQAARGVHGARHGPARHRQPIDAVAYVRALGSRQGERISCPEVVAYENGFIDADPLASLGRAMGKSEYGKNLSAIPGEDAMVRRRTETL